MKRGEILIVGARRGGGGRRGAALGRGRGRREGARRKAGAGAVRVSVRLLAREGAAAQAADRALQPGGSQERRQAGVRRGRVRRVGRGRAQDRPRQAEARGVVAGLLAVGAAAQLRRRSPAGAEGEPVDRAHAAGDRDVGAVREGAGLPEEADRVRAGARAGPREARLRRLRPPAVRRLQAGPHQPRLLHLGPVRGGGRVLRGHRPARGPDREAGHLVEGPRRTCATSSARSSTTATPRCSSPTRCASRARATPRRWRWRR